MREKGEGKGMERKGEGKKEGREERGGDRFPNI